MIEPTDPSWHDAVRAEADTLYTSHDLDGLDSLEGEWIAQRDTIPLHRHVAIKLARSKKLLHALSGPVHVSVVFAMYKENNRLLRPDEHPHGEDFARRKQAQLAWLFDGLPADRAAWSLIAVDDGCPENSGALVAKVFADSPWADRCRVLHLEEAIAQDLPVTRPLTSASQSQKGGAVELGMWDAAQTGHAGHVVVFTDADLSTDLGQVGLIAHEILAHGKDAAIGSRREVRSVAIKKGKRNVRGKLFIYLWKRMLPQLGAIVDTQCGFKGFRADHVGKIVVGMLEKRFAFDIELLLRTELGRADAIAKVPVAWIDSEAASTTTDIGPYLGMLKSIGGMYRHYLTQNSSSDAFAAFVDSLDEAAWKRLVANVPAGIADREPREFGDFDGVGVDELSRNARAL